jgi:histidinol-phosphate aminotransferase
LSKKPDVAILSIMDIAPYKQGTSLVAGKENVVKLSSNENPFGPSPRALSALKNAAGNVRRYPDGGCAKLRAALGMLHNISADRIVCGAGSDELIALLCQAYAGVGDEVLYNEFGFLMYPISAMRSGAVPVTASETDLRVDVDAMIAAATSKTKIVFFANPNNPTGSYITRDEIVRLRDGLPNDVLLVIDSAYAEYVEQDDYTAGMDIVEKYDNVVMLRTFSKAYGLGGLRLGWCYGAVGVVDVLNRVRGPFNVSNLAIDGGIAALEDVEYTQSCIDHNTTARQLVTASLKEFGLKVYPSVANFVLVEFDETSAKNAAAANEYLLDNGIVGRVMVAYKLPHCMRFTIGTEDENNTLIAALAAFFKA